MTERCAIGVEPDDGPEEVELMKQVHRPHRRFAYSGPFKDRNQHQMSGRVR